MNCIWCEGKLNDQIEQDLELCFECLKEQHEVE